MSLAKVPRIFIVLNLFDTVLSLAFGTSLIITELPLLLGGLAILGVFYCCWLGAWGINKGYPSIDGTNSINETVALFETQPRWIFGRKEQYIRLRYRLALMDLEDKDNSHGYTPQYREHYGLINKGPYEESGWWRAIVNEATEDYNRDHCINKTLRRMLR